MKRWWLLVSLVSLFVASVMIAGLELLARTKVDPIVETYVDQQAHHLESFLEDQNFFSSVPQLASALRSGSKAGASTASQDAGKILNSLVAWTPLYEGSKYRGQTWMSATVRDQVLRLKSDWINHFAKYSSLPVKTDFIGELKPFLFWDLERNSPIAEYIERGEFVAPFQLPVPDTVDLSLLAKVHLMRGASSGEALKALGEIRHLSGLMLSTENLHVILAGLTMLDIERTAYRFYVEKGFIREGDWISVDRNTTRRAHRAIIASREYLRLWTPPEILEKVFLNPKMAPLGLCASANEALPGEFMIRPMMLGHVPLERDFSENYVMLAKILRKSQSQCRLTYLSRLIDRDNFKADLPVPWLLTYLPYSRKLFGLKLSTLGLVGFDGYK